MDKKPTHWTPEKQDLFEKYLLAKMDPQERLDFDSRVASNPELKAHFMEFKVMFRSIEMDGLLNKMEEFHQDLEKGGKIIPFINNNIRLFYRFAAIIVILITVGGLWYFNSPSTNEQLFNAHFTPDPGLPTVMGNTDNYAFYEAMVDYKMGKYPIAIEKWEKLLMKDASNDTLIYFLAMANLAEGNANKTISYLEQNLDTGHPAFLEDTYYFLGMAYLKNGNLEVAQQNLLKSDSEKAQEILKSLEK